MRTTIWQKRLSNLLCVKSIITIVMAGVFAFLALTGQISGKDFLNIFSMVIAFYFGTQSERISSMELREEQKQSASAESLAPDGNPSEP